MFRFLHLDGLPIWRTWWRLFSGSYLGACNLIRRIFGRHATSLSEADPQLVKLPVASFPGSTAIFFRVRPGIILKASVKMGEDQIIRERQTVESYFSIERQVLDRLGPHPRIVSFLGWRTEFPTGLLFAEANHGNLQSFLHVHGDAITTDLRVKWFFQAIESIVFIHSRGVIHSDLRPENFLVHGTLPSSLDLRLCDFGGSTCKDLGLSAGKLPDSGFFNPTLPWEPTVAVDLFSLGSVLYAIITGHWPFRAGMGRFTSMEEMEEYEELVDRRFADGNFPGVDGLFGGEIIQGCWTNKFNQAESIMASACKLKSTWSNL